MNKIQRSTPAEPETHFDVYIVARVRGYGMESQVKPRLIRRVQREIEMLFGKQLIDVYEAYSFDGAPSRRQINCLMVDGVNCTCFRQDGLHSLSEEDCLINKRVPSAVRTAKYPSVISMVVE